MKEKYSRERLHVDFTAKEKNTSLKKGEETAAFKERRNIFIKG